jgi:hypothetical protein
MVHPTMNNTHVPPDSVPSGARRPQPHPVVMMDLPVSNRPPPHSGNSGWSNNGTCRPLGAEACFPSRSHVHGRSVHPAPAALHGDAYAMPSERPPPPSAAAAAADPMPKGGDRIREELWKNMQQASCTEDVARISLIHRTVLLLGCVPAANQQHQQAEEWQIEILRNEYANLAQIETRIKMADEHLLQLFQGTTRDSSPSLVEDFVSLATDKLSDIQGLVDDANARVSLGAFHHTRTLPRQEPQRAPSKQTPNHGAHDEDAFRPDAHHAMRRGEGEHPSDGVPSAAGMANERKRKGWEGSMYDEGGQAAVPGNSSGCNGIYDVDNGQARPRQGGGGWAAAAGNGNGNGNADRGRGQAGRQQAPQPQPRGGKGSEAGNGRRDDDHGSAETGIACTTVCLSHHARLNFKKNSWRMKHFISRLFFAEVIKQYAVKVLVCKVTQSMWFACSRAENPWFHDWK